ncbi:MAG: hypothetical protein DRH97_00060 [Chloroflexi bacterium]|nr:MAG: hypothetical protein DRH97_00060 [Chloroflexota bacterium]
MMTRRKFARIMRAKRVALETAGSLRACVNNTMISNVLSSEENQKIEDVEDILRKANELIK